MKKLYILSILLVLGFFMSGMSRPVDDEAVSSTENQKPVKSDLNYSKPHAGIYLDYQSPAKLQVGDPLELELRFKVRDQAELLQVTIRVGDALLLQSDTQYEFNTQKTKNHTVRLLATALKESSARINLSATILVDGRYQSRSFSIPVIIGDPLLLKSTVRGITTGSGYTVDKEQGVVSMPATETAD